MPLQRMRMTLNFLISKAHGPWGWRTGSAIRSACCSSLRTWVHLGTYVPSNSSFGVSTVPFWPQWASTHMSYTHLGGGGEVGVLKSWLSS